LTAWVRPTLTWSIICENFGMTRQDAFTMYSLKLNQTNQINLAADAGMVLYIIMSILYCIAILDCFGFKRAFFFAFYSSRIVLIIVLSIIIRHLLQVT
jgi:hypothetical protein